MFEGMTKAEAAQSIIENVRAYYRNYMQTPAPAENDRLPYAARVYNEEEMANLAESMLEFWLTSGRWTEQFEAKLADYLQTKYCSLVNSGSSANLLAFMALTSPLLGERALRRGDEVITAAACFPTTVTPMLQFGAVPVFADISLPQYNLDVSLLDAARSPKTKAVMLAHTLGNPFDLKAVKDFCDTHQLWLIEDNCDALGSVYEFRGAPRRTGTIGDIGTSSFYPPHHITTGEGGAVYTADPLLHRIIRSLRDWGRDCVCPPGKDGFCGQRFSRRYGELPLGYDHKYVYNHFGYNLKATDMQAAIGCAQLDKLPAFVEKRRENWRRLREGLAGLEDDFILPEPEPHSKPGWFGFMLTCHRRDERNRLAQYLEKSGIQTRMLFAGNLLRHPCFDRLRESGEGFRVAGSLRETDRVMNDTFWLGVYPALDDAALNRMIETVRAGVTAIRSRP